MNQRYSFGSAAWTLAVLGAVMGTITWLQYSPLLDVDYAKSYIFFEGKEKFLEVCKTGANHARLGISFIVGGAIIGILDIISSVRINR